jgi:hypothetical protein
VTPLLAHHSSRCLHVGKVTAAAESDAVIVVGAVHETTPTLASPHHDRQAPAATAKQNALGPSSQPFGKRQPPPDGGKVGVEVVAAASRFKTLVR